MKKKAFAALGAALLIFALAFLWQYGYRGLLKAAYPLRYSDAALKYAGQYGVAPSLVFSVIKNESNFDPRAKSSVGALGLMQLTPETFRWSVSKDPSQKAAFSDSDLYTPEVNIRYGTLVLCLLLREFQDESTAMAAYHAGRGRVNKWLRDSRYSSDGKTLSFIPYATTRSYVNKVLRAQKIYQTLYFNES